MAALYFLAVRLPYPEFWGDQAPFARLFGLVPRITLASLVAYLVGSFLNAIIMSKMKVKTGGRHLWMRTIGSTFVGEGADSMVFNLVAFAGIFPLKQVIFIGISGFLLKTAYEIVATPLTYSVIGFLKRVEDEDVYDRQVSYNPFSRR
jgi:hypothetical protein